MRELPSGTVTFLFTDIEGSTRLLHEFGERYAEALAEHRRALRKAFVRHGGVEVDTQGDAFFVAFTDASEALAAAAEGRDALEGGPVRVRIGLHTGEPLVTEEGYVGIDVHRAARVMSAGHGGQVLVSERTRSLLGDAAELVDLGLHRLKDMVRPEKLFQLGAGEFPPLKTLDATNLPVAASPLLGREHELQELLSLLADGSRLVTITGPGGTGKTRLALQVAAELVGSYADGVFWVPLASLNDPELVLPVITQTLGAREELTDFVRGKELLLLLDNVEHLLASVPRIAELLRASAKLRLLVTSRTPLQLSGEYQYTLEPLPSTDAVTLFVERARAAGRKLEGDVTIEAICRRLDGLPLAIELAAARTKLIPPEPLLQRLEQALPLLTGGSRDAPGRQRTLRATIEWSYDLLGEDERRLFAGLAVFAGIFDLEAAEAVCAADIDTLQSLLDKSLIRRTDEDRFLMLQTIREFALERLEEAHEHDRLREQHAGHFAAVAERDSTAVQQLEPDAIHRVEAMHANFRAALEWAIESDAGEVVLRLFTSLWIFWLTRGHASEGEAWANRVLAMETNAPPEVMGRAMAFAGEFPRYRGDLDRAILVKEEALNLLRLAGDDALSAGVLADLADMTAQQGDFEQARALATEALALRCSLGNSLGIAHATFALAHVEFLAGDFPGAIEFLAETLEPTREAGLKWAEGQSLTMMGNAYRRLADQAKARDHLQRGLELADEARDLPNVSEAVEGTAALVSLLGDFDGAARLYGAAAACREEAGVRAVYVEDRDRELAAVREKLGSDLFERRFAEGRSLSVADAVARALAEVRAID